MTVLAAVTLVIGAVAVARWSWRYQVRVLEALAPSVWLHRLEVRITAVVVHDRSVMLGVRDHTDRRALHTLVVRVRGESDKVVATLERWCRDGDRLEFDQGRSKRRITLRRLNDDRFLSLRLAA
jgi:hypothetical protein